MNSRSIALGIAALLAIPALGLPAHAQVPEGDPADLPVLSAETPRGSGSLAPVAGPAPVAKTIDGDIGDWLGEATRYGGTLAYSAGELVYQDHVFDAYGPDDGRDTARFEQTDPLEENVEGTYRIDALAQADAAGELGIPAPEQFSYNDSYGDAVQHQDNADLVEVRLASDAGNLNVLARTTTMDDTAPTALLVLVDTSPGEDVHEVGFNSGLTTALADVAFFVADGVVRRADLATGTITDVGVAAAGPSGWTNALEASLPLDGATSIAVASGIADEARGGFSHLTIETAADAEPHANVANVAFRTSEPVRMWFEKQQALSLHQGTIDPFFLEVDWDLLASGTSQAYTPGPGYHDRIFVSDESTGVPRESGRDGLFQHYGVYLPQAYSGQPVPLQWWLHWRGGHAHSGAAVVPKVMKQFGEDRDSIVVAPSGRGTSTWYVGRGHVDVLEVWADVFDTFAIDRDRVYASGHSMGGWGSYLLTLLYPDRFAAAAPAAGPVTQGAWTGADFEGCDNMQFEEYTPCYIGANGSDPRAQHTRKLLENLRHVPIEIYHGAADELVPVTGVTRQVERLVELGYRHRYSLFPTQEHFGPPVWDEWERGAAYMHGFAAPANPDRVTYVRDMPFERATERINSGGAELDFEFDSAYWMSGLEPVDAQDGQARFDGRSLAIPAEPYLTTPFAEGPATLGQTGPYLRTGLDWTPTPLGSAPAARNAFEATLAGARAVTLDTLRMRIDPTRLATATVTTDAPLRLTLRGGWKGRPPLVTVDGLPAAFQREDGTISVNLGAGVRALAVAPRQAH